MDIERWLYTVPLRLRALFRRERMDVELDEELRDYVARRTEANVARGMTPDDGRYEALRAIGGLAQHVDACRAARRVRPIEDLLQDLRYGVRMLGRNRGFTAAAVLTLALGIGASVAIFTVVNGVLLRPMPFAEPERLLLVEHGPAAPFMTHAGLSDRDYLAFRERDQLFEHLAAFSGYAASLTGAGEPATIQAASVTTEFFDTLRVIPSIGRPIAPGDDEPGRDDLVVLGQALWRSRLQADPRVVGRQITLNGVPRTVVGVMPPGFDFPFHAEAWTPTRIRFDPHLTMMTPVIGRLQAGATRAQAQAELDAMVRDRSGAAGSDEASWTTAVLPLQELVVGDARRPLMLFAAAVGFVLLIACVNVANLLLARASGRDREIAARTALGATRSRVIRQLLTESTLLAIAGGAGGVLLAAWIVPALLALAPEGKIPRVESIRIDAAVLGFALGVSLATAVAFGLTPAVRIARKQRLGSLLPGGRTPMAGHDRLQGALAVGEIALALVLVTAAGLMLKSFLRLRAVDPGFHPENVVTMTVDLSGPSYATPAQLHGFHAETLARLSAIPGVSAAGAVNWRPLGGALMHGDFYVEGALASAQRIFPDKVAVSPGYFSAMGIRLLRGRAFEDRDTASSPRVAIVSGSIARMFQAQDPIGRRLAFNSDPAAGDWMTIVGVVDDVRQSGPGEAAHAAIYRPYVQVTQPFFLSHMSFVVRARSEPSSLAPSIRAALQQVDPGVPARSIATMSDVLADATADPRFQSRLFGLFAVLALGLAVIGTYGVLSYSVARRTHEIGVRVALGAPPERLLWMVIRRTLALGSVAIALGTAGALATTGLLAKFLFEITPFDPATFATAALAVLTAALVAGWLPARRAARVDPLVALREE